MVNTSEVTGLVLAGGRASRMGGVDKGLQLHQGQELALHVLQRLRPQVGAVAISANRHIECYAAWGAPVWVDTLDGQIGPLAGIATALQQCTTPWLLVVPCDAVRLPLDLCTRLQAAATTQNSALAVARSPVRGTNSAPIGSGGPPQLEPQPVFCLVSTALCDSTWQFVQGGGRRVGEWVAQNQPAWADFHLPQDDPWAFFNANTLDDLQRLDTAFPASALKSEP